MDDERAEFQRLLDAWSDAIVANDADSIGSYATPGWVLVGQTGIVEGVQFLEAARSGRVTHDAMRNEVHRVQVHGEWRW